MGGDGRRKKRRRIRMRVGGRTEEGGLRQGSGGGGKGWERGRGRGR